MKYLKTYEDLKGYLRGQFRPDDVNTIEQMKLTIDDAMSPFIDDGFSLEKGHDDNRYWDIIRVYTKYNPDDGNINIQGDIKDGKIYYGDNFYDKSMYGELIKELENTLSVINGISGIDINFSFTNFYKQDKIILSIKI